MKTNTTNTKTMNTMMTLHTLNTTAASRVGRGRPSRHSWVPSSASQLPVRYLEEENVRCNDAMLIGKQKWNHKKRARSRKPRASQAQRKRLWPRTCTFVRRSAKVRCANKHSGNDQEHRFRYPRPDRELLQNRSCSSLMRTILRDIPRREFFVTLT
jgi:hypothetical protein